MILTTVAMPTLIATPIKRYPLDDRSIYAVRVSTDVPTTVIFPGPLTALDGAGVSMHPEDAPSILISHQAGARYFSVRALHAGAAGAANIIFRDRVFAFSFAVGADPDRTVTFHDTAPGMGIRSTARPSPDHLLVLLDQAREFAALAEQYPPLAQRIERTTPGNIAVTGEIAATTEEVFRFDDEDALVLRVRLENRGSRTFRYPPTHLAVRTGDRNFPVALTDATGELPAGHATLVTAVVVGNADTTRGHLSVKNTFTLALPPLK